MNKKRFIFVIVCGAIIMLVSSTKPVFAYTLLEKVPWAGTTFPEYIVGFYKFAVAFVAIAALLMITIGGFYYITSAGNQAQAGTAKTIVKDALLGLIVVFVSWLILNTINPDLLNAKPCLDGLNGSKPTTNQNDSCYWQGWTDPNVGP